MQTSLLIQLLVLLPVLIAVLVQLAGRHENLRDAISLLGGMTVAGLVLMLTVGFETTATVDVNWGQPLPGLAFAFTVEPLGLLFALVAGLLWPVTTVYAIGYMRGHDEPRQTAFYAWFALAISCTMGIALSANLFTLFIFYELLTLSTYPLVTHGRNEAARRGGRIYLGVLLGVSVLFLLPAIIVTWLVAGTLEFTPGGILHDQVDGVVAGILLVLFVFGIGKAAIMPVHFWLPAAMVAPTPVSALLHAVAVVKAGVFTMLKVTGFIFGIDLLDSLPVTDYLAWLAGGSILVASIIALREDNLKRRLAYSTVSQLSYITLGALLATGSAFIGSAMHIVMHAVAKITLFFCAGALLVLAHKTRVSELGGVGRSMPITMTAFFVASLGIVGVPPTGGTWSKWFLMTGTLESGQWLLAVVLMLSSLLSIVYLLAIPVRAFLPATGDEKTVSLEGRSPMVLALSLTAIMTLALFFFPEPVYRLAQAINLDGGLHGR